MAAGLKQSALLKKLKRFNPIQHLTHKKRHHPSKTIPLQYELVPIAQALPELCQEAEPEFLAIGQTLQSIFTDIMKLTAQIQSAAGLISSSDGDGVLQQLQRLAQDAVGYLTNEKDRVTKICRLFESILSQLQRLLGFCRQFEKLALNLQMLSMNIHIESQRSTKAADMFGVVADETRRISGRIRALSDRNHGIVIAVSKSLGAASQTVMDGAKNLEDLSDQAETAFKHAFDDIKMMVDAMLTAADKAAEQSQKISDQVGELVMNIQFHDNMSQRVAHVVEILTDIISLLDSKDTIEKQYQNESKMILAIQGAQLSSIIEEISQIHSTSRQAFTNLHTNIGSLANGLDDIAQQTENRERVSTQRDLFGSLDSSIQQLEEIVEFAQQLLTPIKKTVDQTGRSIQDISECLQEVHEIGMQTHRMALNAIVKTNRLGTEGQALEVLAMEVQRNATEMARGVEGFSGAIESILTATGQLDQKAFGAEIDNTALADTMADAHRNYNQFNETAAHSQTQTEQIAETVAAACDDLIFLPNLAENLKVYASQLDQLGAQKESTEDIAAQLSQDQIDQLRLRYTMDQERDIHQALLNTQQLPPAGDSGFENSDDSGDFECVDDPTENSIEAPSANNGAVADDSGNFDRFDNQPESDLGDFEMFDDSESENPSNTAPQDDSDVGDFELFDDNQLEQHADPEDQDMGDFELFDASAPDEAPPDTPKTDEQDLGDFELFDNEPELQPKPAPDDAAKTHDMKTDAEADNGNQNQSKTKDADELGDNVTLF